MRRTTTTTSEDRFKSRGTYFSATMVFENGTLKSSSVTVTDDRHPNPMIYIDTPEQAQDLIERLELMKVVFQEMEDEAKP